MWSPFSTTFPINNGLSLAVHFRSACHLLAICLQRQSADYIEHRKQNIGEFEEIIKFIKMRKEHILPSLKKKLIESTQYNT